jgi:hypothetical protein
VEASAHHPAGGGTAPIASRPVRGAGRRRLAVLVGVLAFALGAHLLLGTGGATHHTVHALEAATPSAGGHDHGGGPHGSSSDHDHVVVALCGAAVLAALGVRAGTWLADRTARHTTVLERPSRPSWAQRLDLPGPPAPSPVDAGVVLVV